MSILRQLWRRFFKPTRLVGKDLEGNKYFEHPSAVNGRPKRTVQYRRNDDMWAYIASGRRLPVQWNAWLTHTRQYPPKIEELRADLARQRRVEINAAILEARDQEERERTARLVRASHLRIPESLDPEDEQACHQPSEAPTTMPDKPLGSQVRDPWAEAQQGSDEPQSWAPVARRR
ncbi:hypothetical protein PAXRUDRAFT_271428 [Paxillus rubicundulus Ve08.2h10]|uniref:Unplaced genomic scaffold scaffold_14, whole genome shotgun sequence n=1 Tax=Paxillus rubicundulus Ve08.2h10 TaxID=930991 RepID=A0A0D0DNA3_9AGAM|nr:hypothetical protein PAXRUDRAFT_271428 [Paxillus rubicundulus Ve08.2h10]